jgi:hypothetical protein
VGRAVRIILDPLDFGRDAEFIPFKINFTKKALVSTAPATGCYAAVTVAAFGAVLVLCQGLDRIVLGQASTVSLEEPLPWCDGSGLYNWHWKSGILGSCGN